MKSKTLIYKNGHFYDKDTKQRLAIADGIELTIVAEDKGFLETKPVGKWPTEKPRDSETLERLIKRDKKIDQYKKILNAGKRLFVEISHDGMWHEFEVELKEDLYVYVTKGSKKDEGKLYDCACVVLANVNNTIQYFEEIKGKSLNEVYKNTFVHFFGNKGNPTCNALDRFYEEPGDNETTIGKYRKIEKT